MKGSKPSIDFNRIVFPSDALTIAIIRAHAKERHSFGEHDRSSREMPRVEGIHGLHAMFSDEREFAWQAFVKALASRDPPPFAMRRQWTKEDWSMTATNLNKAYQKYGLTHGKHETMELIREIETVAAQQATQFIDRHLG